MLKEMSEFHREFDRDRVTIMAASRRIASLFLGPDDGTQLREYVEEAIQNVMHVVFERGKTLDEAVEALKKGKTKGCSPAKLERLEDDRWNALANFRGYDVGMLNYLDCVINEEKLGFRCAY